jgi:putative ABC transport system permease protein
MFTNYLKVAFRSIMKNKVLNFINIAGLALGLSIFLLITLYVFEELSFDAFHLKHDRIFRVTELLHSPSKTLHMAVSSPPIAPALKENFPEILKTVRITSSTRTLSFKGLKLYEAKLIYADSTFFEIFTFPLTRGNPTRALVEPYSVVLTETAARKYFGDTEAFGETMLLSDTVALLVTGIMKDIPANSHIQFDAVISRSTYTKNINNVPEDNWFHNDQYTYILLPEGYDYKKLEAKFPAYLEKAMAENKKEWGSWYDFVLQPLTDIHLRSKALWDMSPNGDIKYVYIFSIAALIILCIACANYINLSTARSFKRGKEIGLRKVTGATRNQLAIQMLCESGLLVFISLVFACLIILCVLPAFNEITSKSLTISSFNNSITIAIILLVIPGVTLMAGIYPALYMSSLSPIKTLKDSPHQGGRNSILRKGLVVLQFSASIGFIAATLFIIRQLDYLQGKNLGLNKEQLVTLKMRSSIESKHQLIKEMCQTTPGVLEVSATDFKYEYSSLSNMGMVPEGTIESETRSEFVISVDQNFLNIFNIDLITGRNFSTDISIDEKESFIVNETAVKEFNWKSSEEAIGKTIFWNDWKKGKVIGVVKDFNFISLHEAVKPVIIHILPESYSCVIVKINAGEARETITRLEASWKKMNLDSPFEYSFLSEDYNKLYKSEQVTQNIAGIFSSLSIFIACIGLFGLSVFMAEQRLKEIGIRKVLGASIPAIVNLLSIDFLKLVILATVVAVPITWYGMEKWLSDFAYRIDISWWVFGGAGIVAIFIALVTISFQSIKAAIANPVESLKTE